MKIASLIYSADDNCGTSVVALDQASLFAEAGHDVTIFTLIPAEKKFEVPVKHLPPPLLHLPLWKYPWMYLFAILPPLLHLPLISQCIKPLSKFDMVIAYDYPLNWFAYYAKRRYRLKYLWSLQGLALPEMSDLSIEKFYYHILEKFLYKPSTKNADLVLVETTFLQNLLSRRLSINSEVIPYLTYLSMDRDISGNKIRKKYQLGDNPVILYVDRLEEHKGIETLLDAFQNALKTLPDAKLIIIGKCTRKHFWRRIQARHDSSVIFIDYVPHNEIASFYAASTIFVTCAIFEEGLSHTLLEAQAFGKPVVAFDIFTHREVVIDGETGILVRQAGNSSEFSSAMLKLLQNPELIMTMGKKAITRSIDLAEKTRRDFNNLFNKEP